MSEPNLTTSTQVGKSRGNCDTDLRQSGLRSRTSSGESKTRLYKIWGNIHSRCYCETCHAYKDYGGRGIRMCPEWKDDYTAFRDWALTSGYAGNLTIDRDDVDGDYSPDNCRWATKADQNRNKQWTLWATAFGETKQLCLWARDPRCKVKYATMRKRIASGEDAESAMSRPTRWTTWIGHVSTTPRPGSSVQFAGGEVREVVRLAETKHSI